MVFSKALYQAKLEAAFGHCIALLNSSSTVYTTILCSMHHCTPWPALHTSPPQPWAAPCCSSPASLTAHLSPGPTGSSGGSPPGLGLGGVSPFFFFFFFFFFFCPCVNAHLTWRSALSLSLSLVRFSREEHKTLTWIRIFQKNLWNAKKICGYFSTFVNNTEFLH